LHSNDTPDSLSVKLKLALLLPLEAGGALVIEGAGGATVSTVQVYDVALLKFPAVSRARTANVCEPSARAAVWNGLVHAPKAAPSTLHWKVTPLAVSENANVGCDTLLGSDGVLSNIGAAGADVFTVQV